MKNRRALAVIVFAVSTVAACGDDADTDDAASISTFCDAYEEILSEVDPAATDPVELEANLALWTSTLDDLEETAPDELRDDLRTFQDGFEDHVADIEAADYDIEQVDIDEFWGSDDIAAVGVHMDEYAEETCEDDDEG